LCSSDTFLPARKPSIGVHQTGGRSTCQKINDTDWKRPDLGPIQRGILADGIGCMVGGLLGVMGMNIAPSLVGVSKATGATRRYIAFSWRGDPDHIRLHPEICRAVFAAAAGGDRGLILEPVGKFLVS
jgi:hypothetical protein